jgi:biotin transport system substrate-specific component
MQTAIRHSFSTTFDGFASSIPGKVVLGLAATLVVAAAARVSIPLWFTPVPMTLQPLAVLGVGLALGPVAGFLTMLAYLAEGALGLPVFSPVVGLGGVAQIVGPTGGYLMAYPLVAFIVGAITRGLQWKMPRFAAAAIGCTAAVVVLFVCGAGWLKFQGHLSMPAAWIAGVVPFLPGEAVKIVVASGLYSTLARTRQS